MTPKVIGEGPNRVLALHGWFGNAACWGPFVDAIDTHRFTFAFIDYRGYGSRKLESGDFSMDEIARDALTVADSLGWERFNLIGHSMGGKAIQRVLSMAPQRVGRLVAITPVPASGAEFDDATRAVFESAVTSSDARRGIIAHSVGGRLSAHWVSKMARQSQEGSTNEAFGAYLEAWADGDFSAELVGVTTPIKIIIGRHDPSVTEELMKRSYLLSYPHADLEVLENAGHYPMDEVPVALVTSIEAFLSGEN